MEEEIRKILKEHGLNEDNQNKCLSIITTGILSALIFNSQKLNQEEVKDISKKCEEGNFDLALEVIEKKYMPEEWAEYAEKHVRETISDYVKNVLKVS